MPDDNFGESVSLPTLVGFGLWSRLVCSVSAVAETSPCSLNSLLKAFTAKVSDSPTGSVNGEAEAEGLLNTASWGTSLQTAQGTKGIHSNNVTKTSI